MIDSAQVLSQRMVDRYCAGQLSPEETAEFEAYLLDHPELLNDVEVTRRLKLGLGSLRTKGELPSLVAGSPSRRNPFLAIAASVLLAAGLGWYFLQRGEVSSPVFASSLEAFRADLRAPDAIVEVMLIRARSGEPVELEVPTTPHLYKVRVVTAMAAADVRYDIELRREPPAGGASVLIQRANDVRPDPDGMLSIYLDPRAAGAGTYLVRVLGLGAAHGTTGEFSLTLK